MPAIAHQQQAHPNTDLIQESAHLEDTLRTCTRPPSRHVLLPVQRLSPRLAKLPHVPQRKLTSDFTHPAVELAERGAKHLTPLTHTPPLPGLNLSYPDLSLELSLT
jgi:hypothetical protein